MWFIDHKEFYFRRENMSTWFAVFSAKKNGMRFMDRHIPFCFLGKIPKEGGTFLWQEECKGISGFVAHDLAEV